MVAGMVNLTRRFLFVIAVGALIAACGSSSSSGSGSGSSDVAAVKSTLQRAFRAVSAGDGPGFCSLATPAGQKTLARAIPNASCATVIRKVSTQLSPTQKAALNSIQIKKVKISGRRATVSAADITSTHGSLKGFLQPNSAPSVLTKQPDGTWKISG
jgi:hypothetical protein